MQPPAYNPGAPPAYNPGQPPAYNPGQPPQMYQPSQMPPPMINPPTIDGDKSNTVTDVAAGFPVLPQDPQNFPGQPGGAGEDDLEARLRDLKGM